MVEVAFRIMTIAAKTAFVSSAVIALVAVLTISFSAVALAVNLSVLNDIVAIVQLWLPFNLGVVVGWLVLVASSYIVFRLSILSINIANSWLGKQ